MPEACLICRYKTSVSQTPSKFVNHIFELTSPSPLKLPNATPVPVPRPEGGLPPPLAAGCGIGEGECGGSVTLGLPGIEIGAEAVG